MAVASGRFGTIGEARAQPVRTLPLLSEGELPSLGGAVGWLNSQPLMAGSLRGRVILIDFWTYTCVNWRRTLPYLREWYTKYKDKGLVVVGVHTPEFSFEKNVENVRWAVSDMRIDYPVAIDSDSAIWNAFSNEYWPALYFVDGKFRIRHHQFGEGDYVQSEQVLQQLLGENGANGFDHVQVPVEISGVEVSADWSNLRSNENYVGYERAQGFASPGGFARNRSHIYPISPRLDLNHWALTGAWTVGKEAIVSNEAGGRVTYRFHARDLNLVMGHAVTGSSARYCVRIDGQPPGDAIGADVDSDGNGVVLKPRLYQLIRQRGSISDRQCEIEFLDPGAELYDFTFG